MGGPLVVEVNSCELALGGARHWRVIELVDRPGAYTPEGGSPAEEQVARYVDSKNVDVIVNVADSTHLASLLN